MRKKSLTGGGLLSYKGPASPDARCGGHEDTGRKGEASGVLVRLGYYMSAFMAPGGPVIVTPNFLITQLGEILAARNGDLLTWR